MYKSKAIRTSSNMELEQQKRHILEIINLYSDYKWKLNQSLWEMMHTENL